MNSDRSMWSRTFFNRAQRHVQAVRLCAVLAGLGLLVLCVSLAGQQPGSPKSAPRFKFDPDWPKPLPNKWKMGGVTGLAVDKDDNVWVYDRPNDLTDRKSVV